MKETEFIDWLGDNYITLCIAIKTRSSYEGNDFDCTDYDTEYRLYPIYNRNKNIVGFAVSEQHCGKGPGCFWTPEEFHESSLEEWNKI